MTADAGGDAVALDEVHRLSKQIDPAATVRIDRAQNRVDIDSTQPREALAAAIAEEGYTVAA